jgi:hypothetical protein
MPDTFGEGSYLSFENAQRYYLRWFFGSFLFFGVLFFSIKIVFDLMQFERYAKKSKIEKY